MELPLVSLFVVGLLGYLVFFIGQKKLGKQSFGEKIPIVLGLGIGVLILLFGVISQMD